VNEAIERLAQSPLEHLGQRVITLGQMDEVHQRPEGAARKAFARNRDRLTEGRHYFAVNGRASVSRTDGGRLTGRESDTLLTERGYLVLVKTFRDDLAWRVQEDLVDGYFRAREVARADDGVVGAVLGLRYLFRDVRDTMSTIVRSVGGVAVDVTRGLRLIGEIQDEVVTIRRRQAASGRGTLWPSRRRRKRSPPAAPAVPALAPPAAVAAQISLVPPTPEAPGSQP
jgi:hypothetical protein